MKKQNQHCVHQQWPGHSLNFEELLCGSRLHFHGKTREDDPCEETCLLSNDTIHSHPTQNFTEKYEYRECYEGK